MQFFLTFMSVFTPEQRRRYALLQGYFLLAGLVQVVGVASVAPFIALISNPSLIHGNAVASGLYSRFGFTSDGAFLIAIAIVLMFLIVLSNVVFAGAVWFISAFSLRFGVEIQQDIFRGFLSRDYAEFSRTNSASLVSVLTQDAPRFIFMVVQPLLTFTSQALIVALIVCGLVWYDPPAALTAAILVGGGYWFVFKFLRRELDAQGAVIAKTNFARFRILQEGLGGIKEIKLLGTEPVYERQLHSTNVAGIRASNMIALLGDLPRFVLEPTALCALLGLGIYLLVRHEAPQAIVGTLSLYAMAGYKLMPAAQSVFKSSATIRANSSLLGELLPIINAGRAVPGWPEAAPDALPSGDIQLEHVWYAYPATTTPAIQDVSITIPRHRITVIVGASGAGKSTLADLVLGLLSPTSGTIRVGDQSIRDARASWQRTLGYVPQNIFLLDDTVAANIALGSPQELDMVRVRRAASIARIDDFIESLPGRYEHIVGERGGKLSGGQRQRIAIARALYHDAKVLIFDEATSALDAITEAQILSTIADLKETKTILMIAHRLSTIRAADQIVLMHGGRVQRAGTYDDMLKHSREFRDIVASAQYDLGARTA